MRICQAYSLVKVGFIFECHIQTFPSWMGTSIETLFQANWKNDMLVQVTSAFYKNILDNVPNGLKIITSRSRTCQSRN